MPTKNAEITTLLESSRVSEETIRRARAFERADNALNDLIAALDAVSDSYAGYSDGVKFRDLLARTEELLSDPIASGLIAALKDANREANDDGDDWRGDDLAREEALTGTVR